MSDPHEADWGNEDSCAELTPEQGELLAEELKRFESYLSVSPNWPAALSSPPCNARYDAQGTEVRLTRIEGLEQRVSWWVRWYEDPELEVLNVDDIKIEHEHRIVVMPDGAVGRPSYEQSYTRRNARTGGMEELEPESRLQMIENFAGAPDDEAALKALFSGVSAQLARRMEARRLEETTGINTSTFTSERFDTVMALLAKISDPAQKLQ